MREAVLEKTLILGLGNEFLRDDAVGMRVVQELRRRLSDRNDLDFKEASVAGLAILDLVCGYKNLIVVDAIETQAGEPGQIYRLSEDALPGSGSHASPHGMGLSTVLELGRRCGFLVPEHVVIYAMEVEETRRWQQGCTPRVQRAIQVLAQQIMREELSVDVHPSVN